MGTEYDMTKGFPKQTKNTTLASATVKINKTFIQHLPNKHAILGHREVIFHGNISRHIKFSNLDWIQNDAEEVSSPLDNLYAMSAEMNKALDRLEDLVTKPPSTPTAAEPTTPPQFAEYCLWFLTKDGRERLLGDMQEEFQADLFARGLRSAQARYCWKAFVSASASLLPVLRRLVAIDLLWRHF